MLYVCCIFVWIMIKMQWLPLILNGKSTDKALVVFMKRFILFVCNLFIWFGVVLKFQFSFVIFQFHKETCSNSLIKGHLFNYCIICLESHFVKKLIKKSNREIKIVNRIKLWVEWIVTSLPWIIYFTWKKKKKLKCIVTCIQSASNYFSVGQTL